MPVYQNNLWICEVCGRCESTVYETSPYSDPVVAPPNGEEWEYVISDGKELLACPSCQIKLDIEVMNSNLDVLFDQIEALPDEKKTIATYAVDLWLSAKVQEFVGLVPMEARHIYLEAYDALAGIGLNVSGMIKPYRGQNF